MDSYSINIRQIEKKDAKKIHTLVKKSKVLDLNSEYLYLLQSTHFSETCSVAICDDRVIGFVSGYLLPKNRDTLFIWQVVVDDEFRGNDLAKKLILNIVKRENLKVENIETTVSPTNKASLRVFEKITKSLNTKIVANKFFDSSDFNNEHEEETLYKIGPFKYTKENI